MSPELTYDKLKPYGFVINGWFSHHIMGMTAFNTSGNPKAAVEAAAAARWLCYGKYGHGWKSKGPWCRIGTEKAFVCRCSFSRWRHEGTLQHLRDDERFTKTWHSFIQVNTWRIFQGFPGSCDLCFLSCHHYGRFHFLATFFTVAFGFAHVFVRHFLWLSSSTDPLPTFIRSCSAILEGC